MEIKKGIKDNIAMDCSCNFETDSDAGAGVNFEPFRVKKSRKTHICGECGVKISVGDTYLKNSGIWNSRNQSLDL